jgi:hypothetical protein
MFLLRKFTFWLLALSILICLSDYWGIGFANIVISQFNPVIHAMIITEPFRNWMIDDTKLLFSSVLVSFRFPTYLIHFGTFLVVGLILDYFVQNFVSREIFNHLEEWSYVDEKVSDYNSR